MPSEDPDYDPGVESTYECLACGTRVTSRTATTCPDCGSALRNESLPME